MTEPTYDPRRKAVKTPEPKPEADKKAAQRPTAKSSRRRGKK